MDVRNYFYFLWRVKWKALIVGVIFAICGAVYSVAVTGVTYEGVVFLTVGLEQEAYVHLENAEEYGTKGSTEDDYYFAQTVQGWTMDPSFQEQANLRMTSGSFTVTARQQERQNIIFQVFASDASLIEEAAWVTVDELEERLDSYNETMQTSYKIANPEVTSYLKDPPYKVNAVAGLLLGLLLVIFVQLCYEFFAGIVSFPFQVEKILGKGSIDPSYLGKDGYVLGVGCNVKKKYGRELAHKDDLRKGDYLLVVGIGCAREKELETLKRMVGDCEWITC